MEQAPVLIVPHDLTHAFGRQRSDLHPGMTTAADRIELGARGNQDGARAHPPQDVLYAAAIARRTCRIFFARDNVTVIGAITPRQPRRYRGQSVFLGRVLGAGMLLYPAGFPCGFEPCFSTACALTIPTDLRPTPIGRLAYTRRSDRSCPIRSAPEPPWGPNCHRQSVVAGRTLSSGGYSVQIRRSYPRSPYSRVLGFWPIHVRLRSAA